MNKETAQRLWKERVTSYANAVNAYVKEGRNNGWEHMGEEPGDPDTEKLIDFALDAVREANNRGDTSQLRKDWPPAQRAVISVLEKNGQSIPTVYLLDDGSLLVRIGTSYEPGKTVRISGTVVEEQPDTGIFGRCPNRRFFGVCGKEGVTIHDGWRGPVSAICRWPDGTEGIPKGIPAEPLQKPPVPSAVIPFPDGKRVLLASSDGIFVLTETRAKRLLPTEEEIKDFAEWSLKEHPEDSPIPDLSMEHAAISPSGEFIAVGSQGSTHLIFDSEFNVIADVGPMSEYPHYALFNSDESMIAVNSCHFYNGKTLGIKTSLLPGLKTKSYESDPRVPLLEDNARVYAGVSRQDEFIIGDASGYARAFGFDGVFRWEIFIGSSVGGMDISPDGKTLVVSTYAGFISFIELDSGEPDDYQIGIGNHRESYRWLFWKTEKRPLIW